uniref:Uncharacterized protein n=1 Tax=Arundo donax TaxID=35708 RepID=A0A0A8Y2P6_ARUDO
MRKKLSLSPTKRKWL